MGWNETLPGEILLLILDKEMDMPQLSDLEVHLEECETGNLKFFL